MNREKAFNDSINKLNTAWGNGELLRGDCRACAVTNIIGTYKWRSHFFTTRDENRENPNQLLAVSGKCIANHPFFGLEISNLSDVYDPKEHYEGQELMDKSPYTKEELARIEYAFEASDTSESTKQSQYLGLVAVFDVLADIHGVDISVKELSLESLNNVYAELN